MANSALSGMGVKLHGQGFVITEAQLTSLGIERIPEKLRLIRPYCTSRGLVQSGLGNYVIDLFGLTSEQLRIEFLSRRKGGDPEASVDQWIAQQQQRIDQFRKLVSRARAEGHVSASMLAQIAGQARILLAR